MCYHISLTKKGEQLKTRFKKDWPDGAKFDGHYHANAFVHPYWPVIASDKHNQFQFFQWGLIPFWTKNDQDARTIRNYTPNCIIETAFNKPSFRHAIKSKHCIVPVSGFFEWRDFQKKKYPYYITPKNDDLFCLAGIWDEWVNKDNGLIFKTFSILTTEANAVMSAIHNSKKRMPVIIPENQIENWLREPLSEDQVNKICDLARTTELDWYTIGKRITSRTENPDAAETIIRYDYPELPEIT